MNESGRTRARRHGGQLGWPLCLAFFSSVSNIIVLSQLFHRTIQTTANKRYRLPHPGHTCKKSTPTHFDHHSQINFLSTSSSSRSLYCSSAISLTNKFCVLPSTMVRTEGGGSRKSAISGSCLACHTCKICFVFIDLPNAKNATPFPAAWKHHTLQLETDTLKKTYNVLAATIPTDFALKQNQLLSSQQSHAPSLLSFLQYQSDHFISFLFVISLTANSLSSGNNP